MEFEDDGFASYGGLAFETIKLNEADALLVGIPYESATSGKRGSSFAPVHLRMQSVDLQTISRWGISLETMAIRDVGNIPIFPLNAKQTRESIIKYYSYLLTANTPIIAFGGDHSITYPLISAIAKNTKVGVIWFDAHRDLLPELLGDKYSHGSSLLRTIELPNVDPENVILIGTRYMQIDEQQIIDKTPIHEIKMTEIETNTTIIQQFSTKIKEIAQRVDEIYVSIDIDVLDPAYAPGTGTPVPAGMTTSKLLQFLQAIPVPIRAFDIMEISPPYDFSGITIKAALGILTEIFAHILQHKSNL